MPQPIVFEWNGSAMVPVSSHDLEQCQRWKPGEKARADKLVKPRSLPRQGHYWAWLADVVEATECAPTSEHLHEHILKMTGYQRPVYLPDGRIDWVRDSTAFNAMGEHEFAKYVDAAKRYVAETWGIDPNAVERAA